ncbi:MULTISPECIES: IS66 family insertion sequence element accessory protein TnpB [unclassified Duganella]|uniref:IS66 family insertion sequence element accessory protein TnpB n=1 Tax=unclassified Duganella TaxID=2636909 RepID=UPI000B7C7BE2
MNLLWWTDDDQCLLAKRFERGRFVWPQASAPKHLHLQIGELPLEFLGPCNKCSTTPCNAG